MMLCTTRRTTTTIVRRAYSTGRHTHEDWLYIDSVFPIQFARWDIRYYIGLLRQEHVLSSLNSRLEQLSSVRDFKPLELQPYPKDGGVFVRFSYTVAPTIGDQDNGPHTNPSVEDNNGVKTIERELREEVDKHGPLPSWLGSFRVRLHPSTLWLVKGVPWLEDMNRYASPILKLAFEGPDVQEEVLFKLCRPYGRIKDLTPPTLVPAGSLRSSTITYHRSHAATIARNVIHGISLPPEALQTQSGTVTRIRTQYQRPLQAHVVRDWISSHPRITLPILVFLLGTLTYTIFDPIRAFMIEAKMLNWFDYRQFRIYQWLRSNTVDRIFTTFGIPQPSSQSSSPAGTPMDIDISKPEEVWKERKEAESAIKTYLSEFPTTISFIHGPQGSGKSSLLSSVLHSTDRSSLIIDVKSLNDASSDTALVANLGKQTGYRPLFTFWNSISNMVDLASVGIIGQKAGMSTSTQDQLRQVLTVVTSALNSVSASRRVAIKKGIECEEGRRLEELEAEHRREAIRNGTWHDGRIDCVAGNGVISELGVGIERFDGEYDEKGTRNAGEPEREPKKQGLKVQEDIDAIRSLPIVVLKNFSSTSKTSPTKDEMLVVLAQWAAALVENKIAHVIVLSDNRENGKRLAKALPSKPLQSIALSDADTASSLSFVKQKLYDSGIKIDISRQETESIERLGGRASDLESLIHKARSGMEVSEAVEDIINRGVAELRKNAFGDDTEDAKSLPWTREQVWHVLKALAKKPEVGYYSILLDFPFKGDESALRNMEHAELIAIGMVEGRPSFVRPGKPVLRYVFERVVGDKLFEATQELAYNEKQIVEAEAKIKGYENELVVLMDTMKKENDQRWWGWGLFGRSACWGRVRFLGNKLALTERKLEVLDKKNNEWKHVIKECRL